MNHFRYTANCYSTIPATPDSAMNYQYINCSLVCTSVVWKSTRTWPSQPELNSDILYALCLMLYDPMTSSTQLPLHSFYIFWHSAKLRWTKNGRSQHISWGHIISPTFYPYPITIFGTLPPFCNSHSAFSDIFTTSDSNVKTTPTLLTLMF